MPRHLVASLLAAAVPAFAGEIALREVSQPWGLDFRHHHGGSGNFYMIETMGSGVVLLDYDGDGDQDVLFVDSGPTPGYEGEPPATRLYRNDGGRFIDVTERSGIRVAGYGMGAAVGDVDGDGDADLYVTAFGPNQLFRNEGDGTFTDVTAAAGVGDPRWSASAAFTDLDRDGDLDLYVANYLDFSYEDNPQCGDAERGLRSYCHPDVYPGVPDRFYRNRGDGTFEDTTAAAGMTMADGKGLGVVASDLDGDGWPDLYVANDSTPNFLFRNRGDGTCEEVGLAAGVALGERGQPEAGMGVAVGDVDGDGRSDLYVTHLDLESNALYSGAGETLFLDRRFASGLAESSLYRVGFGTALGDLDHDADLDLVVANGHIIHNIEAWGRNTTYAQANQVFANDGSGRFLEVDAGLEAVRVSRGLALGDLDGDGDLDLAISNSNDTAEVYENVSAAGAWLQVAPRVGPGGSPAVGCRVGVVTGERRQDRELVGGGSYLSQNDQTLHFGLGDATRVDRLRWRCGARTVGEYRDLPAARRYVLAPRAFTGR